MKIRSALNCILYWKGHIVHFLALHTVLKLPYLAKRMHKLTVPRVSFQSAGATLLLGRVSVWMYYQDVTPLLDRVWVSQQRKVTFRVQETVTIASVVLETGYVV